MGLVVPRTVNNTVIFCLFLLIFSETGSHCEAQSGMEFTMQHRLISNSMIPLPQSSERENRSVPLHLAYSFVAIIQIGLECSSTGRVLTQHARGWARAPVHMNWGSDGCLCDPSIGGGGGKHTRGQGKLSETVPAFPTPLLFLCNFQTCTS